MARRRLLTLLATSALLTGAFAGPAAALDLDEASTVAPVDVAATTAAVEDTVAELAEQVAAPAAEDLPVVEAVTPEPEAAPRSEPSAPSRSVPSDAGSGDDRGVVAAGGVTSAPPIDLLISLGGSEATPTREAGRVDTPAMSTVDATTDEVLPPQVAPAPAAVTAPVASAPTSPSVLAQAIDGLPEEGAPALALVALAALFAAGAGTVQTARAEAAL